jgi:hypothetical protein
VNTVVITNFYYRTPMTHTMPVWLKRFFLQILPRLLLIESPKLREKQIEYELLLNNKTVQSIILDNPSHILEETNPDNRRASYMSYIKNKRRTSTIIMKAFARLKHHRRKEKQTFIIIENENRLIPIHRRRNQIDKMRGELVQALSHVRFIAAHCAEEALIESIRDEWKFIATVIDRLQFVIFSAVTIIGSFALLFQVPHIFQLGSNDPQKLVRFSNPNSTIHELILTTRS